MRRRHAYKIAATHELQRNADFLWAEDEANFRYMTGKQFQKIERIPDAKNNHWFMLFETFSRESRLKKDVLTVWWSGGQHAVKISPMADRTAPTHLRFREGETFCGLRFFDVEDARVGSAKINELACERCRDGVTHVRL